MREVVISGISPGFPELSRSEGQITHVLLTRSPLVYPRRSLTARLACVKHAASVRPEPGSNSPLKNHKQNNEKQTPTRKTTFPVKENPHHDTNNPHTKTQRKSHRRRPRGKKCIDFQNTLLSSQKSTTTPRTNHTSQPQRQPNQPYPISRTGSNPVPHLEDTAGIGVGDNRPPGRDGGGLGAQPGLTAVQQPPVAAV